MRKRWIIIVSYLIVEFFILKFFNDAFMAGTDTINSGGIIGFGTINFMLLFLLFSLPLWIGIIIYWKKSSKNNLTPPPDTKRKAI